MSSRVGKDCRSERPFDFVLLAAGEESFFCFREDFLLFLSSDDDEDEDDEDEDDEDEDDEDEDDDDEDDDEELESESEASNNNCAAAADNVATGAGTVTGGGLG